MTSSTPPSTTLALPPDAAARPAMSLRRYTALVGWGLLVTTLGQMVGTGCIGYYTLRFLLKDRLGVQPTEMAAWFFWTTLPWSFKPIAGLIADGVPLWGRRRRYYLILGGLCAGGLWLAMAVVPRTYAALMAVAFALNAMMVLASVVTGGLLVEGGQAHGATGRLSALRLVIINVATIVGAPVGGFFAGQRFGWTAVTGGMLFLSLIPVTLGLLREPKVTAAERRASLGVLAQLRGVLRHRDLWICGGLFFLVQVAPGMGTPLLYYQTNTLRFSPQFIGNLGMVYGGAGLLASLVYPLVCRRVRLRRLLGLAIACTVVSNLGYLGYVSRETAMVVEGAAGLGLTLAQLPLFDLAARAAARGSEALAYSLMIALWNIGLSLSDVIGSAMYDHLHLTFRDLVWINAGTTALILLVIPFLPGRLVDHREGEAVPTGERAKGE